MKLIFAIICIGVGFQIVYTQTDATLPQVDSFRSPFRYVIVAGVTDLEKYVNRFDATLYLEVLMEDRAFNETNLRELFKLISRRFPKQQLLSIDVFTTLDAIKTPEENDHSNLKGPVENYKEYKYAFFSRRPNKCDAYFSYAVPGQPVEKITLKCDENERLIFDTEDTEGVSEESATDCEEGRRMIDNALYEIKDEPKTKIEFVLHSGNGEAKKIADQRESYVLALCGSRGFPEKCSVTLGDARKGLGAIDVLIKGDLYGAIYFRKNEPSPCPNPANWDIY